MEEAVAAAAPGDSRSWLEHFGDCEGLPGRIYTLVAATANADDRRAGERFVAPVRY